MAVSMVMPGCMTAELAAKVPGRDRCVAGGFCNLSCYCSLEFSNYVVDCRKLPIVCHLKEAP